MFDGDNMKNSNTKKTKIYWRGNNLIGLKKTIGFAGNEGLMEAKRYAATRNQSREASPALPQTPSEVVNNIENYKIPLMGS